MLIALLVEAIGVAGSGVLVEFTRDGEGRVSWSGASDLTGGGYQRIAVLW